jgi:hypothetical protein
MIKVNILFILLLQIIASNISITQAYDLRFLEVLNNGTNYDVKIQIRSNSDFKLASSNITFNFNIAGLSNPTLLTAYNFIPPAYNDMTVTNPNSGVASINIVYIKDEAASAYTVDTNWVDVATVRFTTIDISQISNLSFRSTGHSNTVVYSCIGSGGPPPGGTYTTTLLEIPGTISANLKVFLEGPYSGSGTMTTTLNTNNQIPFNSNTAYPTSSFEYIASTVGSIPGSNMVDWLLVELRKGTASGTKVTTRAAFLKNDGTIVDVDGSSPVAFTGVSAGNYYIVVRHRNHLAIMSANAVSLSGSSSLYNFTTAQTKAYTSGTDPMVALTGGGYGMIAGDANGDGFISAGDKNSYWFPQNGLNGYLSGDFNLNSFVTSGDKNLFWFPNNGLATQVP